ncbi:transcriptional regulator [Bradyrhizobium centrolobii]|uniref:Transcriptional regulator n=1 Tax=Bradyrhizobium centrolobii TaxID=1505087 RepID=A0A176YPM5_9BRAD|nr:LysR family transcriptional regulator [Bradyrhizobium centrolobii]OAF08359.1 transcriptional regulator [Bradyrhizobium centrolobii]
MDRLDAMRLFTRVVERRSFTQAANDIGLPRSSATQVIHQLERRLGVRLLQRTTRVVRPTLDGEAYYRRCLAILQDVEDAEGAFAGTKPKGMLRIEVQGTLARHFLMPNLPKFFTEYPEVEISMSESDRWVDLVHEGVDCALRWGELADSGLVARRLAVLKRITCAAPSYLKRFGRPKSFADLARHQVVGLRRFTSGELEPLRFVVDGKLQDLSLPAPFSVTGPESYIAATRLGLGIAQMPRFHIADDLARGSLVALLPDSPPPSAPVSLMYAQNRQLTPRVRAFSDWLAQEFRKAGS